MLGESKRKLKKLAGHIQKPGSSKVLKWQFLVDIFFFLDTDTLVWEWGTLLSYFFSHNSVYTVSIQLADLELSFCLLSRTGQMISGLMRLFSETTEISYCQRKTGYKLNTQYKKVAQQQQ